jgi:hypothetical protein
LPLIVGVAHAVPAEPTAKPAQIAIAAKPRAMVMILFLPWSQSVQQATVMWWIKDYDRFAGSAFVNVSALLRSR